MEFVVRKDRLGGSFGGNCCATGGDEAVTQHVLRGRGENRARWDIGSGFAGFEQGFDVGSGEDFLFHGVLRLGKWLVVKGIENGDGDGVDGDVVIKWCGGLGTFDDADDVALTGTEVVEGDERVILGERRRGLTGGVEMLGVHRVAHQPPASLEGGVLHVQGDPADDLGDAHGSVDDALDEVSNG